MHRLSFFLPLLLAGVARSQATPGPQSPPKNSVIPRSDVPVRPPLPARFNANFSGDWSGTLEYRDYSAASPDAPHTRLPTLLTMRPSPDGRAVNFDFTYDDGVGKDGRRKIVTERTILAFTADTAILTGTGSAQNQVFAVAGLDAFTPRGLGTLILTGQGQENDQPADMRLTLTLTATQFTWRKETRPAGSAGAFVFRDEYALTRVPSALR